MCVCACVRACVRVCVWKFTCVCLCVGGGGWRYKKNCGKWTINVLSWVSFWLCWGYLCVTVEIMYYLVSYCCVYLIRYCLDYLVWCCLGYLVCYCWGYHSVTFGVWLRMSVFRLPCIHYCWVCSWGHIWYWGYFFCSATLFGILVVTDVCYCWVISVCHILGYQYVLLSGLTVFYVWG